MEQKTRPLHRVMCWCAVCAVVMVSGCSKTEKKELKILCGNSFVTPMEKLVSEFKAATGIQVAMTSAGSEDFLPQIKAGRIGDVLVSHDPFLDHVKEADAYGDHVQTGYVAPVLAVPKGNPGGVKDINDLGRPGVKVALTNPEYSTCGEMVYRLLEKKGTKEQVLANVGNRLTKGHGELGNFLKTRAVDAVIMWNGKAHDFKEDLDIIPTPYEYDSEIRVHVIGLGYSKMPTELKQFMDFVRRRGPEVFTEYGYTK